MKKRIAEQSILFISVLKWVFLATVVGAVVGFSTSLFLLTLTAATEFTGRFQYYFLALPAAFCLSVILVRRLAPEAEGHGTEKVIEAVHKRSGKIPLAVVPVKLAATVITLASGGSAGKEGPCAQIGAGLASALADLFRFAAKDRKKLVICGISAGFASVFGTPIAGAIFGVEVLFVGGLLYDVLLPSFVSGIMAYQVSTALGVKYFSHSIPFTPIFHESFFLMVALSGVYFGICSFLFIEMLAATDRLSRALPWSRIQKALAGGALISLAGLIFSTRYLGLGLETIEQALKGGTVSWFAFPLKALLTAVTLNFGGSGGIVTPLFYLGATSGSLFANITGLDPATFSAIGLVAVLAGAANTPIAAGILSIELFGRSIGPYACVACVISFLMTGHRSVYPSQILSVKKSQSLDVPIGEEMEDVRAKIRIREKSLVSMMVRSFKTVRDWIRSRLRNGK